MSKDVKLPDDSGSVASLQSGDLVDCRKLDSVMARQAGDDFYAMQTANAMQSLAGVEVVSIVFQPGAYSDRWHVFAKYDSSRVTPKQVDAAIDQAMD
jgi:hypothetical protein